MISSVTTTTVSTVTSAASIAAFGLVATLTLIAFLVVKELASSGNDARLQTLARILNVGIVPLLMVFVAIVAAKVVEVL
jgi:sulfite exporter TauE/SafE